MHLERYQYTYIQQTQTGIELSQQISSLSLGEPLTDRGRGGMLSSHSAGLIVEQVSTKFENINHRMIAIYEYLSHLKPQGQNQELQPTTFQQHPDARFKSAEGIYKLFFLIIFLPK